MIEVSRRPIHRSSHGQEAPADAKALRSWDPPLYVRKRMQRQDRRSAAVGCSNRQVGGSTQQGSRRQRRSTQQQLLVHIAMLIQESGSYKDTRRLRAFTAALRSVGPNHTLSASISPRRDAEQSPLSSSSGRPNPACANECATARVGALSQCAKGSSLLRSPPLLAANHRFRARIRLASPVGRGPKPPRWRPRPAASRPGAREYGEQQHRAVCTSDRNRPQP